MCLSQSGCSEVGKGMPCSIRSQKISVMSLIYNGLLCVVNVNVSGDFCSAGDVDTEVVIILILRFVGSIF